MARLSVFGTLDLRSPEGDEVRPVLAQPKRLAVLVYLAVEGRFVQRDALQALFWPESDGQRARQSLNRTVYFLRRALGDDVLVSRGSELGVDAGALASDVADFVAAEASRRPADALGVYLGEVCPGFHAGPDLVDFDLWLEGRRDHFRRRARGAAEALSRESAGSGDVEGSIAWALRAVAADPFHEAAVRQLMTLLAKSGNRARALETYAHLSERLSQTLGVDPDPETTAMARELASREGPPPVDGPAVRGSTNAPDAPATPKAASSPATPVDRSWRARVPVRRMTTFAVVLAALAWAGLKIGRARSGGPGAGAPQAAVPPGYGGRVPTQDPEAFEAFRRGEEAFKLGRFEEAIDAYRTAITKDPAMAPGYVRLSIAANEGGDYDLAKWAADQGLARTGDMGRFDSLFAVGWYDHLNVRPERAMAAYEAILADTLDPDALANLADVRFHWGPTLGIAPVSTIPLWRQVLTLRPRQVSPLTHLIRLEAFSGDTAGLATSLRALEEAAPDRQERYEAEILAAATLGHTAVEGLADELRALPDGRRWTLLMVLGVFAPRGGTKDALMQALAEGSGENRTRMAVLRGGVMAADQGWPAADAFLRARLADTPERRVEVRVDLALATGDAVPRDTLASLLTQLRATDPDRFIGAMDLSQDGIYPPRRLFLLTALAERAGARELVGRFREDLRAYVPRTGVDSLRAEEYTPVVDAFLALESGDPRRALDTLGPPHAPPDRLLADVLSFPRALSRWVRAEALLSLGRRDEAVSWLRTFPDPAGNDLGFLPAVRARLSGMGEATTGSVDAAPGG